MALQRYEQLLYEIMMNAMNTGMADFTAGPLGYPIVAKHSAVLGTRMPIGLHMSSVIVDNGYHNQGWLFLLPSDVQNVAQAVSDLGNQSSCHELQCGLMIGVTEHGMIYVERPQQRMYLGPYHAKDQVSVSVTQLTTAMDNDAHPVVCEVRATQRTSTLQRIEKSDGGSLLRRLSLKREGSLRSKPISRKNSFLKAFKETML